MNPAPSPYHQTVSLRLASELMNLVEKEGLGRVLCAPIDVHLGRGTVVQPDILVLRNRNRSLIGPSKLTGAPDMLVEILSPSNRAYDCRTKKQRYERAGVREFWLVDPEQQVAEQYSLRNGRYGTPVVSGTSLRLRILRGIVVDFGEIW